MIGGWSGRRRGLSGVRNIIHRMGGNGSGPAFPRPPDPGGLRLIMGYYVKVGSGREAGQYMVDIKLEIPALEQLPEEVSSQ